MPPPFRRPPILNRRRAARFAAVQALYQIEVGAAPPREVVSEFIEHRLDELLEPLELAVPSPEVDREWFVLVALGAWSRRERLDPLLDGALSDGWTLQRCGFLLRATLRAGAFELAEREEVPVKVVINEYVELAHLFFDGSEPGFVNAVLDRLAVGLRGEGSAPAGRDGER
jgi:N utilization substance protein B